MVKHGPGEKTGALDASADATPDNTQHNTSGTATSETDVKINVDLDKTPEDIAKETGRPYHFEGTITKVNADGDLVLSDHLMPGEKLHRVDEQAEAKKLAERAEATNQQSK